VQIRSRDAQNLESTKPSISNVRLTPKIFETLFLSRKRPPQQMNQTARLWQTCTRLRLPCHPTVGLKFPLDPKILGSLNHSQLGCRAERDDRNGRVRVCDHRVGTLPPYRRARLRELHSQRGFLTPKEFMNFTPEQVISSQHPKRLSALNPNPSMSYPKPEIQSRARLRSTFHPPSPNIHPPPSTLHPSPSTLHHSARLFAVYPPEWCLRLLAG